MKFYKDGHTEINFNPRSREGSDKSSQSLSNAVNQISIHAPAKGATCSSDNLFPSQSISIHAPAKGATDSAHNLRFIHVFQSTLPRRERLFESYGICFRVDISIHAPAKGATSQVPHNCRTLSYFNPRSREGSDCHVKVYISLDA